MQTKLIKRLFLLCAVFYSFEQIAFPDVRSTTGILNFDANSDNNPEMILNSTGLGVGVVPSCNLHVAGNMIVANSLSVGGQNASGSNIHITGTLGFGFRTVSSNSTLDSSSVVFADTSSGNLTIECPIASTAEGREYTIKKISLQNTLTIAGGPFDRQADLTLSNNSSMPSLMLLSSGGNWHILHVSGNGVTVGSDNLVGWWKLDEASGNVAYDTTSYSKVGFTHNPILMPPAAKLS